MSRLPSRFASSSRRVAASHPTVAGFRPAAAALAVAAAFGLQSAPLRAQPVGGQAIAGQASFVRNGSNLLVTTQNALGTSHSAINWQSFSVPTGSVTQFNQPSATSTSINRVLGADPSSIFGTLSSNGRLVLVNPAGIAVGAGAVVDTAGFTASTLGMSEADAIAGRLRFAGNGGPLQVDGTIVARSGDVVLVAPNVQTGGAAVVQAANGATVLAAGRKVEITGRGLEGIRLEVQAPEDQAVNLGTLQGDAVGIFAGTLKHSGLVQARAVTAEGGKVLLRAQGDDLVSGAIQAAGSGGRGGSIDVLGERVGLLAGAALDASGAQGGGQVRVGGDYQGLNPDVANAKRSYVDAQASIHADATVNGDGGRVIVWSDEATRMHGQVSARGGAAGGNGGFAEVSGKQYLAFSGRADLRAPGGKAGTLLLDPNDVDIVAAGTLLGNPSPQSGGYFDGGDVVTQIDAGVLGTQLNASDVQVATAYGSNGPQGGQIHLLNNATVTWSTANSLSLNANNGIQLDGTIDAPLGKLHFVSQTGNIAQSAGSNIRASALYAASGIYGGSVGSQGGHILMADPGAINKIDTIAGHAYGPGAEFRFQNAGTLTIGTASTYWGSGTGITVYDGPNLGPIAVSTSAGDLNVSNASYLQGSSVQLKSAGNLNVEGTSLYAYTGLLSLDAVGGVNVGQASYVSLYGGGGPTQGVRIKADGGDVRLGSPAYSSYINSQSSPIDITASGGILSNASMYTRGTLDGWIHLTANGGPATFSSLNSYGSYSGIPGGEIRVWARDSVDGASAYSYGGYTYSSAGPAGGAVMLESGTGSVTIGNVASYGGYNYSSIGPGGAGGGVTLRALGTGGAVSVGSINADGGYSYQDGGIGGAIVIQSDAALTSSGNLSARGGSNGSGFAGGNGGNGGSVDASSANGSMSLGYVNVSGGSSYLLGKGGDAGDVTLRALGTGGAVTLQYNIYAQGGTASSVGNGGNGGDVLVQGGGNVQLQTVDATGGGGGSAAIVKGGDGGTITVTSTNGNVSFGTKSGSSVTSSGGAMVTGGYGGSLAAGGQGGAITLQAMGTGAGAGNVLVTGSLSAQGGYTQDGSGGSARNGTPSNAVTVDAQRDIDIAYLYADGGSMYAGPGGVGGKAALTSTAGNIWLGYTTAVGSQGGNVRLTANGGNIVLDSADVGGRYGYSLAPGGNGGSIVLDAAGSATVTNSLYAVGGGGDAYAAGNGGSVAVNAGGAVQVQNIFAYGGYGYAVPGGGNGGSIQLHSLGGDVTAAGSLDASGSYGGNGGSILVQADAGNISLQQATASGTYTGSGVVGGMGGTITLMAQGTGAGGGNATVAGSLDVRGGSAGQDGTGGRGGDVTVQVNKQIQLGSVNATGGGVSASLGSGSGGAGGNVLLSSVAGNIATTGLVDVSGGWGNPGGQAGTVQVNAPGGSVSIYEIYAQGGSGNVPGSAGGMGGTVNVQAQGDIVFSDSGYNGVFADGGGGSGGAGGQGGNVTLQSSGGNISLIDRYGSYGVSAQGGSGSTGGAGGAIDIEAAQNVTTVLVQASGGAANAGGGRGGDGGSIHLRAGGQLLANYLYAYGGYGGNGQAAGQAGGNGGAGGTIDAEAAGGDQAFTSLQMLASGGNGGDAYYDGTPSVAGGTGGTGGRVTLTAGGGSLSLSGTFLSANGGYGGYYSDDFTAAGSGAGGNVTTQAAVNLDVNSALYLGNASFLGRAGGNVTVSTAISTAGAPVTLSAGDAAAPAPQPGAVLAVHAPVDTTQSGTSPGGPILLAAPGNIVLDSSSGAMMGGQVTAMSGATLQLAQPINSDAFGDAVVLAANSLDVGASGSIATPNGRWLAYLPGPAGNNFGGLVSGNYALWGRTFANSPPGTVAEPGNRYLFAFQPTVDIVAQATSKVYDGTPLTFGLGYTNTPLVDASAYGDVFLQDVFTGSLQAPAANKNVGSYTISLGTLGVAGYAIGSFTGNVATITPRTLNVGASAANKVYDGTTAATLTGLTDDRVAGDALTLSAAAANFNDKNVGTAKPVTVAGIGVSGTDAGNYVLASSSASTSADITPRTLTVNASAANKVYDGTAAATLTGFADDRVAGDVLTVSAASASFNNKNVGTAKPVTVAGIGVSGTDAGNYVLAGSSASTSADITARGLNVTATAADKVYDGTTAATVTGLADDRVAGDVLTVSAASASFNDRNVGTAKPVTLAGLGLTGTDAGNYVLVSASAGTQATITPAPLTVAASADSRSYDGTVASGATPTIAAGTLFAGDSASFTQVFDNRHAGTGKTLTASGTIADGNGGNNYTLTLVPNTSGVITPAAITVTAVADSKTYDATTSSSAAPAITSGTVFGSDTATLSQAFADKNAGTGKVLLPAAAINDGNGGADYRVTLVNNTAGVILPKDLSITGPQLSKIQGDELVLDGAAMMDRVAVSGLVGGERVDSVALASDGAPAAAPASAYPVAVSNAAGSAGFLVGNYNIHYVPGTLAVFTAGTVPEPPINPVITFANLFVQEAKAQDDLDKKKTDIGKDDIVVTDTQCKP